MYHCQVKEGLPFSLLALPDLLTSCKCDAKLRIILHAHSTIMSSDEKFQAKVARLAKLLDNRLEETITSKSATILTIRIMLMDTGGMCYFFIQL